MDVLSDVLQAVRLSGAVFFDIRAGDRLIAQTPNMDLVATEVMPGHAHVIPFHIMVRGQCWLESLESDDPPAEFQEGDVVFYPHGHSHIFVSELGDRLPPNLSVYRRPEGMPLPMAHNLFTEGPPRIRFVCGYLGCDRAPFNPLLEALPSRVLAKRPPEGNHLEVDLIDTAIAESEAGRAGGETILARLSELLFVRVLRRYIEDLPEHSGGWLAGLQDAQISTALRLMHAEPAHGWSVESLARECGMSRAVFASRFGDVVGDTPMRYLAKWRMQLATRLLEQPRIAMEEVAERVGYQSEAAFNRAFKNILGTPPGTWRRNRLATADVETAPEE